MTAQTPSVLKSHFNTGDIPTESNFADLIDTYDTVYNVKSYGAVGDGISDDTLAIQTAVNLSGKVYFPVGQYRITSPINITKPITIEGAGRGIGPTDIAQTMSEIVLDAPSPLAAFNITSSGVVIRDMSFHGNKDVVGATTGIGILVCGTASAVDSVFMESVRVLNFKESGIVVRDTVFMTEFLDVYSNSNAGYGVLTESPNGGICAINMINCIFCLNSLGQYKNTYAGFFGNFINCVFADGLIGLDSTTITGTGGSFLLLGCSFENGTIGFKYRGSKGVVVEGCSFGGQSDSCMYFTYASRVFIGINNINSAGAVNGGINVEINTIGGNCYILDRDITGTSMKGFYILQSANNSITQNRPVSAKTGELYFDTTLGIPIWWNGTIWINASGGSV